MKPLRALAIACAIAASARTEARPLVVMPPWNGLSVVLFPEELELLRGVVRDFIVSHRELDFEVVPREKLAPLERRIADGRLRDGGPQCAEAPRLDDVLERELPHALRAWINLDCAKSGCALDVIVHSTDRGDTKQWIWSAALDGEGLPRDWLRAVSRLKPVKDPTPAGYTYRSGVAPPTVRAILMHIAGGWPSADAPEAKLTAAQSVLDACHAAARRYTPHYYVSLLKVRQDGSVARVHVTHEPDQPSEACVVGALASLHFERGPATRRARIAVVDDGAPLVLADARYGVTAEVPFARASGSYSIEEKLPLDELRGCYVESKAVEPLRFAVTLDVEESGHVAAARVQPPSRHEAALADCLEQALRKARLPCNGDGSPVVARFTLALAPYLLPADNKE